MEKVVFFEQFGAFKVNALAEKFNNLSFVASMEALSNFERPLHALYNRTRVIVRNNPTINVSYIEIVFKNKNRPRKYCFVAYPITQVIVSDDQVLIHDDFVEYPAKKNCIYFIRYGKHTGEIVRCSKVREDGSMEFTHNGDIFVSCKNHYRPASDAEKRLRLKGGNNGC